MTATSKDENVIYSVDNGLTIRQFAKKVATLGKIGIQNEYFQIKAEGPTSTIAACLANPQKNRYNDVYCFDRDRVVLQCSGDTADETGYIHANYVDGHKQRGAYICTQGPFNHTIPDFWQMVWQEGSVVIVSLTKIVEAGKQKCGEYWPVREGNVSTFGKITISTKSIRTAKDYSYTVSQLKVTNTSTNENRKMMHLLYLHWPDFGTPVDSKTFLKFREVVNSTQERLVKSASHWQKPTAPPIIIHCSAGVGRTGTLVALDVCLRQLMDTSKVDVPGVLRRIRQQRYLAVQKPDQYAFLNLGIIEFAIMNDILSGDEVDLRGFLDTGIVETPAPIAVPLAVPVVGIVGAPTIIIGAKRDAMQFRFRTGKQTEMRTVLHVAETKQLLTNKPSDQTQRQAAIPPADAKGPATAKKTKSQPCVARTTKD